MTLDRLPARAVGTEAAATVHQLLNDRLDPEALAQPSWQQPALATAWAPWYLPGIGADPAVGIRIGHGAHHRLPNLPTADRSRSTPAQQPGTRQEPARAGGRPASVSP
jgi:hypothetical protein